MESKDLDNDEYGEEQKPDPEFIKSEKKLRRAKLAVQIIGIVITLALVAVIGVVILKNGIGR